jgi:hypothetical protein
LTLTITFRSRSVLARFRCWKKKGELHMKLTKIATFAIGASLCLASGAFAGDEAKGKLHLINPVTIDGKQVKAGEYNVQREGSGADVKLVITKGKQTIATVPAHQVEEKAAHNEEGYGSRTEADGSKTLTTVFFGGNKYDLQAGTNQAAQTQNGSTAGNK